MATPYSVVELVETGSTQDDARRAFMGSAPVLVLAARQTKGRGRTGARWETAPRAVAASLAFAPEWPSHLWSLLPLLAGVAVCRAVAAVGLKWPNDIVVGDGKAGGLLVEAGDGVVVAGLGLNLWWPEAPDGMIALHPDDPGPSEPRRVAEGWADGLCRLVEAGPAAWPRDEYRERCVTVGRRVTWEAGGRVESGLAVDVDGDGGLIVETGSGRSVLRSGAVRHVRPAT